MFFKLRSFESVGCKTNHTQLMESTIKQANIHITTRRTSKQTKKQGYNERTTDTNKCVDSHTHTHALAEVRFAFNVIKTCWQSGSVRNGVLCGIGFSPRCSARNSVQKFWFSWFAAITDSLCLSLPWSGSRTVMWHIPFRSASDMMWSLGSHLVWLPPTTRRPWPWDSGQGWFGDEGLIPKMVNMLQL